MLTDINIIDSESNQREKQKVSVDAMVEGGGGERVGVKGVSERVGGGEGGGGERGGEWGGEQAVHVLLGAQLQDGAQGRSNVVPLYALQHRKHLSVGVF